MNNEFGDITAFLTEPVVRAATRAPNYDYAPIEVRTAIIETIIVENLSHNDQRGFVPLATILQKTPYEQTTVRDALIHLGSYKDLAASDGGQKYALSCGLLSRLAAQTECARLPASGNAVRSTAALFNPPRFNSFEVE